MLEDRLTPSAVFRFAATADVTTVPQYETATNWTVLAGTSNWGYPVDGDELFFQAIASGPGTEEGPPPPVSYNCVIPDAYCFAGLHLQGGYTGTVSVQDTTSTGILELRSGKIAQLGTNPYLFVTVGIDFTGGTLNSTATRGHIYLDLTAASIVGNTAVTVTTGSILDVGSGTLRYGDGIIAFANQSSIHSFAGSVVVPAYPESTTIGSFVGIGNDVRVRHLIEGDFTLRNNSQQAFLVTAAGHLKIVYTTNIQGHSDNAVANSASLAMNSATARITATNGMTLTLQHGYAMSDGIFKTEHVAALGYSNTLGIIGSMNVTGGTLRMSSDAIGGHLGAVSVAGDIYFSGGTFEAKVVGDTGSAERNLWRCTGKVTLTAASTITPIVVGDALPNNPNRSWNVVTGDGGFDDTTITPLTAAGWNFWYDGDPKTRLFIRKP